MDIGSGTIAHPASNPGKDIADLRAKQRENGDDHHSYQNQNQCILHQPLPFAG
jgi:hypothetical protein